MSHNTSITVLVRWHARPDAVVALDQLLDDTRASTLGARGCLDYSVMHHPQDPLQRLLLSRWTSAAAYDGYMAWRHHTGVLQRFADMLAQPAVAERWLATPLRSEVHA